MLFTQTRNKTKLFNAVFLQRTVFISLTMRLRERLAEVFNFLPQINTTDFKSRSATHLNYEGINTHLTKVGVCQLMISFRVISTSNTSRSHEIADKLAINT